MASKYLLFSFAWMQLVLAHDTNDSRILLRLTYVGLS